jgi:ketosteroid isomerase-like protein
MKLSNEKLFRFDGKRSTKLILCLIICLASVIVASSQSSEQRIYDTERAFERLVAGKGIRAGFLEYLSPDAVMFFPEAANARETWSKRPVSPAALTWNPVLIFASSNDVLAYSIGNSVYRPKGKDDPTGFAGHYLSVWVRQANGEYRAVFDTGINHDPPAAVTTEWSVPAGSGVEKNERRLSAADSATPFFAKAESEGTVKAYQSYLAEDAILMRDGSMPFKGRNAAIEYLKKGKTVIKFAKRKSFVEAADLAYHYSSYSETDKAGKEIGRGGYAQVWRLRSGKWQIVADIFVPLPAAK